MKLADALKANGIGIILIDFDRILTFAASNAPKGIAFPRDMCEQIGELFENLFVHNVPVSIVTQLRDEWDLITKTPEFDLDLTEIELVGSNHWVPVLDMLKVKPKVVLAIGDSLVPSLWKAHAPGVRRFVWVDKPIIRNFYRTGPPPRGTIVVNEVMEIIPRLMKMPWK